MKLVVRGVHVSVTRRLREHIEAQLAAPCERLFPEPAAELEVHLVDNTANKRGVDKECRVTLHVPGGSALHLIQVSDDLFKSVSLVSARLDHAAKRWLERRHDHHVRDVMSPGA